MSESLLLAALLGSMLGNAAQWFAGRKARKAIDDLVALERLHRALRSERDELKRAVGVAHASIRAMRTAADMTAAEHLRRLRFYREQVEKCTDPAARGAIALNALRELLSSEPGDDFVDRGQADRMPTRKP